MLVTDIQQSSFKFETSVSSEVPKPKDRGTKKID